MVDFKKLMKKEQSTHPNVTQAHPESDDSLWEYIDAHMPPAPAPEPPPVVLSAEQQSVKDAIDSGCNVLVTGSAGTGKSEILKALLRDNPNLPVTASTGIAAVNVGGCTIHSWAGIGLGEDPVAQLAGRITGNRGKHYDRIRGAARICLDEVSMIGAPLLRTLDHVFRLVRENPNPFGGIQMVFFGDFLQLPPVIKGTPNPEIFAFQTDSWAAAGVKTHLLTKVWRQADAEFSAALNDIRMGEVSDRARSILNARFKAPDPDPTQPPVVVHVTNADVDQENAEKLALLSGEMETYDAMDSGRPGAVEMLRKHCIAPSELNLKVGVRVMLLKNLDTSEGLCNGTMGTVVNFLGEKKAYCRRTPVVRFMNGHELSITSARWETKEDGKVVASREQLPLRLAWAITTHKSQGMSLDKVRLHLGKTFEYGQAYVALSRARTVEGLFIESSKAGCIRAHPEAVKFYTR